MNRPYDGAGWPLTLTTPYGQTSFAMTSGTWPYLGRAIIVTEPGGSRQGLIKVSINHKTVTPFSPKMVS